MKNIVSGKFLHLILTIGILVLSFMLGTGAAYFRQCAANCIPVSSRSSPVSASSCSWGLKFSSDGKAPSAPASAEELADYNAYYIGDQNENVIYLTFDVGYENGNTERILDALKKHDITAAFFVVGTYIESQPELIRRMVQDGHVVGNHTWNHPDMSEITDVNTFKKELTDVEEAFSNVTGEKMSAFFRPPQGRFSSQSLQLANELGYQTIFWSLAYEDWNQNAQPAEETAIDKLTRRIHPGAVVLLHNTSSTNAAILDELLTKWENMGYQIRPLTDLAEQKPESSKSQSQIQ